MFIERDKIKNIIKAYKKDDDDELANILYELNFLNNQTQLNILATKDDFKMLIEMTNKRFESVDKRFEDMNKRFETVDKRFENMNGRIICLLL